MRLLYSAAWWLLLPLVLARLWWRGRREAGYRRNIAERLGFYGAAIDQRYAGKMLWVHAVSVGETRAAEPLVDALLAKYRGHAIILTHMTPTGRATGQALFAHHGERVVQAFLPYDTGFMTARFLRHFAPRLCVLMETEVWPNLVAQCARRHVPVALVNARLSERSLKRARSMGRLMRDAAAGVTRVAAQTEADAQRLRQFGVDDVLVTGSIKFDVLPPEQAQVAGAQLRSQIGLRPVLLCASTREGEEVLILEALRGQGSVMIDNLLLVIVPRHPQRFDEVAMLVQSQGLKIQRRST
ncbi:MAG: 3-deoxy-D-manno-octulosonic acid transferase, partial [Janthinobacterium lividum]